jgi:hypothetical protein
MFSRDLCIFRISLELGIGFRREFDRFRGRGRALCSFLALLAGRRALPSNLSRCS